MPVDVGFFYNTEAEARKAITGNIGLVLCRTCYFVWNSKYEFNKIDLSPGYEASLQVSAEFRSYIKELCEKLVKRYKLENKKILDIGCGDGYFLESICRLGGSEGVGIDPTVKIPGRKNLVHGSVNYIRDYFAKEHNTWIRDFVCCMSVFENIPDPLAFLALLRRGIDNDFDTHFYFEVPNAKHMLEEQIGWSVYYEQCNYFTIESLINVFTNSGFDCLDCGSAYLDGQYIFIEAKPSDQDTSKYGENEFEDIEGIEGLANRFMDSYISSIAHWKGVFEKISENNERVVVWGAAGKGVHFLNAVPEAKHIRYVVDVNPMRQGKYIPGSGQKVMPPNELANYNPHKVILTNKIYLHEVRSCLNELQIPCEILTLN